MLLFSRLIAGMLGRELATIMRAQTVKLIGTDKITAEKVLTAKKAAITAARELPAFETLKVKRKIELTYRGLSWRHGARAIQLMTHMHATPKFMLFPAMTRAGIF